MQGGIAALTSVNVWLVFDIAVVTSSLKCANSILQDPANRRLCDKRTLGSFVGTMMRHKDNPAIVEASMGAMALACANREDLKASLDYDHQVIPMLVEALRRYQTLPGVAKEACGVMSSLLSRDDLTVATDNCLQRSIDLKGASGLTAAVDALRAFPLHAGVATTVLSTLAAAALEEGNWKHMVGCYNGIRELLIAALEDHSKELSVSIDACSLLGAIGQDTKQREAIGECHGVEHIIDALDRFSFDQKLVGRAVKALCSLTTRHEKNCARVADFDGTHIKLVCKCMKVHKEEQGVQAQCCALFRNLWSRDGERLMLVRAAGAEDLIRSATHHARCSEFAFDTLRELRQDITLCRHLPTGAHWITTPPMLDVDRSSLQTMVSVEGPASPQLRSLPLPTSNLLKLNDNDTALPTKALPLRGPLDKPQD